jgi:hypothetical protein
MIGQDKFSYRNSKMLIIMIAIKTVTNTMAKKYNVAKKDLLSTQNVFLVLKN